LLEKAGECQNFRPHVVVQRIGFRLEFVADRDFLSH
jgi:hypothetical protein